MLACWVPEVAPVNPAVLSPARLTFCAPLRMKVPEPDRAPRNRLVRVPGDQPAGGARIASIRGPGRDSANYFARRRRYQPSPTAATPSDRTDEGSGTGATTKPWLSSWA